MIPNARQALKRFGTAPLPFGKTEFEDETEKAGNRSKARERAKGKGPNAPLENAARVKKTRKNRVPIGIGATVSANTGPTAVCHTMDLKGGLRNVNQKQFSLPQRKGRRQGRS